MLALFIIGIFYLTAISISDAGEPLNYKEQTDPWFMVEPTNEKEE